MLPFDSNSTDRHPSGVARLVILIAVAAAVLTLSAGAALACSCFQRPLNDELDTTYSVFSGRVDSLTIESGSGFPMVAAHIEVADNYYGEAQSGTVVVLTSSNTAACGASLLADTWYLFFVTSDESGAMYTSLCSRTVRLEAGSELIEQLSHRGDLGDIQDALQHLEGVDLGGIWAVDPVMG
ncbi:MAG: hypothetical protein KC561_19320, partial [Myxococcales bacterium]|nr:hypothetical protein [Myxococcales bacterium]